MKPADETVVESEVDADNVCDVNSDASSEEDLSLLIIEAL